MVSRPMMIGYLSLFLAIILVFRFHHHTLTRVINEKVFDSPQPLPDSNGEKNEMSCRVDESVKRMYEIQLKRRVGIMKLALNGQSEWHGFARLYNGIVPEVFCPSLVRVGNVDDGGKWVCHPMGMPDGCVIMSLGVNYDTTFEREIQQLTNQKCSIHSYDKKDPGSAINNFDKINTFFHKGLISSVDNLAENKRSVKGEMTRLGIKRIEILKIDIEGAEFIVIPDLIEQTTFCQILIEIHGSPSRVIKLITQMAHKGYRMFSYEINGRKLQLSEYSFIHDDCLAQYEATPLVYYWHLVD